MCGLARRSSGIDKNKIRRPGEALGALPDFYSNLTDTLPIAPKSASNTSPDWIGSGGWQVPVVTIWPARKVMPS